MKRFLLLIPLLLLWSSVGRAQGGFTTVTAVVRDPSGSPYVNCHGDAVFVPSPTATTQPFLNGSLFQTDVVISQCDSFGAFTIILADNNQVSDGHVVGTQASQWRFNISSQDSKSNFSCTLTITGTLQDVSTALQACAAPLAAQAGGGGAFVVKTLPCASTMVFGLAGIAPTSANTAFTLTLTCNVASTTIAAPAGGTIQLGTVAQFTLIQDNVGGHTFAWPSNFIDRPSIQVTANSTTNASFWYDGTSWHAQTFPASGGGGSNPGGSNGQVQCNVASVLNACLPATVNAVYVSSTGNDANDGYTFWTPKLTIYAALQALPGGSAGVAGTGTVYLTGTVNYGGPVANQGMWLMSSGDPNFSSPPSGWLTWSPFAGQSLTIDCIGKNLAGAHGHAAGCGIQAGSTTKPASWFSGTGQVINLRNFGFIGLANQYIRIGIDSNGNRNINGASSISISGVGFGFGNCAAGLGPGIDIGNNSFWIWMDNIVAGGCVSQIFTVAASTGASRTSNLTTITTTATNNISVGDTVTIQNVSDDTFNGSYTVASTPTSSTFTYTNLGPDNSVGGGQVITAGAAAININPGTGGGSGLIFIDNINLNNGGIRFTPGTNGGGMYVRNVSYEGDFSHPDMPPVLVTKEIDPTIVRVSNVEIADPSVSIPDVRVDNPSQTNADSVIVDRVDGCLIGIMHTLGSGSPCDIKTPLRAGQYGFTNGVLTAYGIDVARRSFSPSIAPGSNLASTVPSTWVFSPGAGTVTNVAAPDGTNNAGRVTSSSGQSFITFYLQNSATINVGDFYIFGVWARSNTANGYSNAAPPVKFGINNNGFGAGDSCIPFVSAVSALFYASTLRGDGQWQWFSGVCKINSAPTLAGLVFTGIVDTTHTTDFYAPTLIKFAAGTKSDNEAWEIANNLQSFSANVPAGTVSMLRGQSFAMSVGSNFLLNHTGTITADRTVTWPDANGTVPYPSLAQTWTANQTFSNTSQLRFLSTNGTNYAGFQGGASVSNLVWLFPTTDSSGTQCLSSNGSLQLAWSNCSGGTGTPGGANTQVQYNNSGSFGGSTNLTWVSPALSIGSAAGATGQIKHIGVTSGVVTEQSQDVAGTWTFKWPNSAGSNGQPMITDGTGVASWGTLGFAGGGTNQTTFTANQLVTDTAGSLASVAGSTTGTNPILKLQPSSAVNTALTLDTAATPTADILDVNVNTVKTSWFDSAANLHTPTVTLAGTGALSLSGTEGTCPAPISGVDIICLGDSAVHAGKISNNGATFKAIPAWTNDNPAAHGVALVSGTFPQLSFTNAGATGLPLVGQGISADPLFAILGVVGGGTGVATLPAHSVPIAEGTSPFASVGPSATANLPLLNQVGGDPVYAALPLNGAGVTNILPIANGGTGASTLSGANIVTASASFTLGNCLKAGGSTIATDSGAPCGGGSAPARLDQITAATGSSTINSTINPITWNWALTGSTTAFKFGENTAATGTNNILLQITTANASTAIPFQTDNNGNGWQLSASGQWQPKGTGTLATGIAAHTLPINEGTSAIASVGPGTTNQLLAAVSSADPNYKSLADLTPSVYAAGGGTAQAQTATLSPAATSLTAGLYACWKPAAANTGSGATLALNGLTATTITRFGAAALLANDLTTTAVACTVYDGTNFELLNPQAPTASNRVTASPNSNYTFTNSGAFLSSGVGTVSITPASLGEFLITGYAQLSNNTVDDSAYCAIYRTTGSIPTAGSAVNGGDVNVVPFGAPISQASGLLDATFSAFDTGLSKSTSYKYYFACTTASAGTGTLSTQSLLQVSEL